MRRARVGFLLVCIFSLSYSQTSYLPVDSLFGNEIPLSRFDDQSYDLGTEFEVIYNGYITKARLFSSMNEGGNHTVRLWENNGSGYVLAAGPFNWLFNPGFHGWREYVFREPVQVDAGKKYVISISNGPDFNYSRTFNFNTQNRGPFIRYIRGVYTWVEGSVPNYNYLNSAYYRDVVFAINKGNLNPGSVGAGQYTCYNIAPDAIRQITRPTGGTGEYTFQWQSSTDNLHWTNIPGANSEFFLPPVLTESTYFRRNVTSGNFGPVSSASVNINVFSSARMVKSADIFHNTSFTFSVNLNGGKLPYTLTYSVNGKSRPPVSDYKSGSKISIGLLASGTHEIKLLSVVDANGCIVQNLGNDLVINVRPGESVLTNKALVIINSSSQYYTDYINAIKPYLDNFGIPYDQINVATTPPGDMKRYSIIILGHKNVYNSNYPISDIESAVAAGVGFYSFDSHFFENETKFNNVISPHHINSNHLRVLNTEHFITRLHDPDPYNPTDAINLVGAWNVNQNSNLIGGIDLVTANSAESSISLMQVAYYGDGRIVKWSSYEWMNDNILGYLYGMDDLIWRGIVWAARKPFVIQGLPPMITMRVDDVMGTGGGVTENFEWIKIANEFGLIPWSGTFNNSIPQNNIPILKDLIDNNKTTASPHSFTSSRFIYYNHSNSPDFDAVANTREAKGFYDRNGLKISTYIVPHFYEVSSAAFPEIRAMGSEFIATHMVPGQLYYGSPVTPWLNVAPYRINRNGTATARRPVFYGGPISANGVTLFNILTEIRDDGGYEWYPDNGVAPTSSRGIRHLKRSLNGMVLATLFTHEYYFNNISPENWKEILKRISGALTKYDPEYVSMDYAVRYIRAKTNIKITDVTENYAAVEISYSGTNDMDTKCYLFTEKDEQITHVFITLPQISGNRKMVLSKADNDSIIINPPARISITGYPNPSDDIFNLYLSENETKIEASITVFNSFGQIVMQKKAVFEPGNQVVPLPTSELSNGIYFVKVSQEKNEIGTIKIVVVH